MFLGRVARVIILTGIVGSLAACSGNGLFRRGGVESIPSAEKTQMKERADAQRAALQASVGSGLKEEYDVGGSNSTVWDLFRNSDDPNTTVEVNKYLWQASLEVLNFLPIETVDPFTGVIVTGYGTPPGSNRAYRATVYVQDPALDARSLRVSLQTRGGGGVSPETVRAVEDAIMTRARQLRIRDAKL